MKALAMLAICGLILTVAKRKKKKGDAVCWMVFGPPGTGKTTLAVKYARKAIKNGRKVYTNFPCDGCYKLDSVEIGINEYRDALLLIDEAGIDFNNRDYKNFPKHVLKYVKLHRHYGTDMIFFSQGWDDCDKKIRTICSQYFYLGKIGPITYIRKIRKRVGVDKETHDIVDQYIVPSILFSRGAIGFCYRPKYYKYFSSWDAPKLGEPKAEHWTTKEDKQKKEEAAK